MINLIILLWILKRLTAPTWIYLLIGLNVVLRILGEYNNWKHKQK